ncbi:hypothetical protein SDC9_11680 [bioreactor metagenome]|uniref:Uncharacterized protein n=1 Tax=bioreactor metagenome TaxID=1076179 RepID=A0A644TIA9_9ZZZZ|nr:hypothetical protein TRIP_E160209 [uncultured Spirochaetota bacterium]
MSNEQLMKVIVSLGALGYRVVSVSPQFSEGDSLGNKYETRRTVLVIGPADPDKPGASLR